MRILWVSDGFVKTGFGRVAHTLIDGLKSLFNDNLEVYHIALNYNGEPHNFSHMLVPAKLGGDIYGIGQLSRVLKYDNNWDVIFLFNDMPVIDFYLDEIKKIGKGDSTKIIVYFPVDSKFPRIEWFRNYDIVDEVITYTNFGKNQVQPLIPDKKVHVLYHGVDFSLFKPVDREEAIKSVFGDKVFEQVKDAVIYFNGNRNQPRKRIDLTIAGFSKFVKEFGLAPSDVRLYLHMGLRDAGWDLVRLFRFYEVEHFILLSKASPYHPYTDDETYNTILNVGDIGINTSSGEGFGLVPIEHASLGKPQVVAKNSVIEELFDQIGGGYYIECPIPLWAIGHTVLFEEPTIDTVSDALKKSFIDFTRGKARLPNTDKIRELFDWDTIVREFYEILVG